MSCWVLTHTFILPPKPQPAHLTPLGRDLSALIAGVSPPLPQSTEPRNQLRAVGEVNPIPSHAIPSPLLNQALALKCIKQAQAPTVPRHLRSPVPWGRGHHFPVWSPTGWQRRSTAPSPGMQKGRSLRQIYERSLAGHEDRRTDGHHPVASLSPCFAFTTYFPNYSTAAGTHLGLPSLARSDLSLSQAKSSLHPHLLREFNFHSFFRFARLIQPPLPLSGSPMAAVSG